MDVFGTTVQVIQLVYQTTIFIRDVTNDVKDYGDAKRDISERLEHELAFVETFKYVCFEQEGALMKYEQVRDSIRRDVKHCLDALNRAISDYRFEATKYDGTIPTSNADVEGAADSLAKTDLQDGDARLKDRMKAKYQVWKKKAAPLQWSLFGKEKMEKMLENYKQWTDRLRQTLSVILLLVGTPSTESGYHQRAANLRISDVSERQRRAREPPPANYDALKGQMKDDITPIGGQTVIKGVYEDESGFDTKEVIVEIRQYDEALSLATQDHNADEIKALKEPLRKLSWLLQAPMDAVPSSRDSENDYGMYTLSCIGFVDEPRKNRSLLLYQLPPALSTISDPPSLHTLINKGMAEKPTLGNRFGIARALAATVLAIHTSGWVHKNIWSRSVLLLPDPKDPREMHPYLVGWDVARPNYAGTSLAGIFELEPNLYHHEQRFGKPGQKFSNGHDIYALGVVLLEIGLWKTMSAIFAGPLKAKPEFSTAEQLSLFRRVNGVIVDKAKGMELRREVGNEYAAVVQRCLQWRPSTTADEASELSISFRTEVVDALSAGSKL
ncbi:hypothetical protein AOQ84DRAFT_354134 [Glonium stellatum]|uniref:Protein kinase domain-containing protein n=1 Tax=Glonium stellatum TaxID=574774 RepID=A0A8E2F2P5_9PEZI|nr:hypothetical protein AOQ84DRAFT_354134 [Glonium stellatum]